MSFVKWWPTQHALPRSAILTEMVSTEATRSSTAFLSGVDDVFSKEMPDMSRVSKSLRRC